MLKYVTISKFALISGYTENAIRTKLRDGIWREGREWIKAPDGRILINTEGYETWAETDGVLPSPQKAASRLRFNTKGKGAGSALKSSPPPLI